MTKWANCHPGQEFYYPLISYAPSNHNGSVQGGQRNVRGSYQGKERYHAGNMPWARALHRGVFWVIVELLILTTFYFLFFLLDISRH